MQFPHANYSKNWELFQFVGRKGQGLYFLLRSLTNDIDYWKPPSFWKQLAFSICIHISFCEELYGWVTLQWLCRDIVLNLVHFLVFCQMIGCTLGMFWKPLWVDGKTTCILFVFLPLVAALCMVGLDLLTCEYFFIKN